MTKQLSVLYFLKRERDRPLKNPIRISNSAGPSAQALEMKSSPARAAASQSMSQIVNTHLTSSLGAEAPSPRPFLLASARCTRTRRYIVQAERIRERGSLIAGAWPRRFFAFANYASDSWRALAENQFPQNAFLIDRAGPGD